MSDSTIEHILLTSTNHRKLVKSLEELDYAPSALQQISSYLDNLEAELAKTSTRLSKLAEKTSKEKKEFEALRDSTARRISYKLIGKSESIKSKTEKEERDYLEALQDEMNTRNGPLADLKTRVKDAKAEKAELKTLCDKHASASRELELLYRSIFDGPNPDFPEEDALEREVRSAQAAHDNIQAQLNQESQVASILADANRLMKSCTAQIQEALGYSRYDMFGGGSMADMMERNALTNAQTTAARVGMLVDQAQRISPAVKNIGPMRIAQGSIISDVLFDNIWTDMAFHDKIKQSADEVSRAEGRLRVELNEASSRTATIGSQVSQASQALRQRREYLDKVRRQTYENVVNTQGPPPPQFDTLFDQNPPAPSQQRPPGDVSPPTGPPPDYFPQPGVPVPAAPVAAESAPPAVEMPAPSSAEEAPLLNESLPGYNRPARGSYLPPPGPPPGTAASTRASLIGPSSSTAAPSAAQTEANTRYWESWNSLNPYAAMLSERASR